MKLILIAVLLLALQTTTCETTNPDNKKAHAEAPCPRHSDHRLADPHAHNDFRAKLGLPPTEWATRVIADEQAAYLRCVEDMR